MIDILLSTYNGEKYLNNLLDSLFGQSYQHFKIIIRDDGSSDKTLEIINEYILKFHDKIILIEDDLKLMCAKKSFFEVLKYSTSKYIMFCDQDDVWFKDKIITTLNEMKRLERGLKDDIPILIYTDLIVTDDNLNVISNSFIRTQKLDLKVSTLNRLLLQNNVTGCTIMINKKVKSFIKYPINDSVIMHDWWLSIICSCFGKISFIDKPTLMYRQHQNNTIGAKKTNLFSSIFNFKSEKDRVVSSLYKAFNQGEYFSTLYFNELGFPQKEVFTHFCKLSKVKGLRRIKIYIKNGFLKSSFVMRLVQIVFSYC